MLAAARDEHREHAGDGEALTTGTARPLVVNSFDGSLLRVPDTPANRAAFGSVGTAGDSAAWPCVRLFPLNDCWTRSLPGMPWGPAGTDKSAAGQRLPGAAMRDFAHVFTKGRVWLLDRLWHGTGRLAALAGHTHFLARLKSDIGLEKVSEILPGGSYRAEIPGGGVTLEVRVIECFAEAEGQKAGEMFCLITDLLDWQDHPAIELARLCKWRWDGSGTALREARAPLHGAGPGTGAMLRSGSPELIAQEIAAWACGTEMTRGVTRDAARAAQPARKGRRTGQPAGSRDLSLTRARRAILARIRSGRAGCQALTREISRFRNTCDRNRHRPRKSKSPSTFPHAALKDTVTRIAPAVITLANTPA